MSPFPQHLIDGYRTFASERLPTEQSRYRELSERGQSPEVMVIGCCDSRVSPEAIFDAGPGELFVVRNIANLVRDPLHKEELESLHFRAQTTARRPAPARHASSCHARCHR